MADEMAGLTPTVITLDAEESAFLRDLMARTQALPPAAQLRRRRFLEQCAAFATYCETFGRFPDWAVHPDRYDNAGP